MTTDQRQLLDGLRKGAVLRDRARGEHKQAVEQVRRLAQQGREAGVPMTEMAKAAGTSRQSLYELVEAAPPPPRSAPGGQSTAGRRRN